MRAIITTTSCDLNDGTLTVSLYLPDFSSMEFLSVTDTGVVTAKHPFITSFWKQHEGVRLYSLSTSSAASTLHWIRSQGFRIDSIRIGPLLN